MKKTKKKTSRLLTALTAAIFILIGNINFGFGQTAIYTVSTTSAVTTSGTAPSGSSAIYGQTYGTAKQITKDNSATLTLSGYAGMRITQIVLSMHSNNSTGKGTLSVIAGSTSITSISPSVAFSSVDWYGAWSNPTYVNVTKTPTAYSIGSGENVIIQIEATQNSLYIESYTITYAPVVTAPTLITTASTLSSLNYTVISGPSTAQTFNLTGSNLDGSAVNLQVTNTDFQISSDNTTYSNSINFPAYDGTSKTIYVRLKAGLAVSTYSDIISISGGGVAAINQPSVAISGAVLAIVPPTISSSNSQSVVYGTAASYQIVASQSPTSYSATSLPAGLSINTSTGLISGTPTVDVGSYISTINATNAGGTGTLTLTWNITPKPLTISGLSIANKVYDGNATASLSGTATLTGIVGSDNVLLSGTSSANFANKNVGTAKTVTISGYTLSGTKAGNYSLAQPTLTANINAKSLTISGVSANNKVYDGNTNATLSGGTLSGVISPDVVTLSGGGTFASSNAGTGISVTSNLTISGADGGNYTLTQPTGLIANITKVNPVFTSSTITLNVGATYDLPGANVSSTSPGTITYSISSGGNATLAGITISGVTVGTETLTVTQAASTNYNAGSTTVSVNVITFTYLNGDVRPLYDYGNFSYNGTWEEYSGGSWTPRSLAPQNSIPSGRIIIHKLDINGAGNVTTSYDNDILVLNGGSLILDATVGVIKDFIKTGKSLEIQDGGKVTLNGQIQLNSGANLIVRSGGTLELNSSAIHNNHPFWNGNENFEKGSFVVIRKWDWSANITTRALLNSSLSSSQITSNANGYKFGNLIIDTELGDDWTLVPGSTFSGLKLCDDNLEILNESPTYLITGTSNNSSGFIVNGDFIIYDGRFNFGTTFGGNTSHSNNYIVYGDFICISNDKLILHEVQNGSSTPTGSLTVHGNFEIGNGVLTFSNQGSKKVILKEGDATNSRYIDVATLVINVPFEIEDGYRILKSNNLEFGNSSSMLVKEDASLNFGFKNSGLPLHILSTATATNNSFTAQVKSTLYITSPSGIMSAGDLGNVQTNSRTFATVSPFADYHYIGKQNQITGTALPFNARNLTINNEVATNDVTLSQNLTTTMLLTMLNGNVRTDAYLFELGKSLTLKGTLAHTNGFVVGKMRRWFDGTNTGNSTGLYPMGFTDLLIGSGLKNRHAKIEFNTPPAIGGHLTIEYIGAPMGLDGIPIAAVNSGGAGFDVTTTEDQGYWKIDNEAGKLIGANYTISCTGEGYQTITSLAELTLLKRVGGGNWFCPGTHLTTTGTIAMPTCSRSGVSDWSNFGFGGSVANPLPVKLTAFNVSCDENQIDIQWTTASEQNSSHFVVEKSRDLINWTSVSQVQAAGSSNHEIDYSSVDLNGSNGVFYYRLKQVDYNGKSEIYGPISVNCDNSQNEMNVYPNPSNGDFTVEINWNKPNTSTQIQIIDLTGKIIQEMDLNLNVGTTQVAFNQENLQMGTYLIRIQESNLGLKPVRLVIKK